MSYVVIDFDLNLCYSGWMMITALFGTFGVLLALMWKRNETPTNYILLAVFVSCTSLFFVCVLFWSTPPPPPHTHTHTHMVWHIRCASHTHVEAKWLAWLTGNSGHIGAIGSSPSNGLKPNL